MKNLVKVVTLCFMLIVVAGSVSAFDFDNVKTFDKDIGEYGTIEITNAFGYGDKLAEYTLIDNTDICIINCEASGIAKLYSSGYLFTDLKFKDKLNNFIDIKSNEIFLYQNISYQYLDENNKTQTEYYMGWDIYDNTELPIGTYEWKIKGVKEPHESVDWIGTAFGEDFTEWAWWDALEGSYEVFSVVDTDSFLVPATSTGVVDVLVVAGGGGGGDSGASGRYAGGGGAGGLIHDETYSVTTGESITVIVGGGGADGSSSDNDAENGTDSSFGTLTAIGGGGGGLGGWTSKSTDGQPGGSGGGGGSDEANAGAGGTGTALQGNNGGNGQLLGVGGGGGGAGGAGAHAAASGDGGVGLSVWGTTLASGGDGYGSIVGGANTGNGGSENQDGGSGLVIVRWDPVPTIVLNLPTDNYNSNNNLNTYNCTITSEDNTIENATLWTNETSWSAKNVTTGLSNSVETVTWDESYQSGTYLWTCYACNDKGGCVFDDENRTLIIQNTFGLDITYPTNNTYGDNITDLNYTYISGVPDKCWYSNDTGTTNYSVQDCTSNFTGMINVEGLNTWIIYMNNSFGEESSDKVTFTVDTTKPALNITYPLDYVDYHLNNTNLRLTWTHSDDNADTCWYVYNNTNVTVNCDLSYHDINITNMTDTTLIMYANDTVGAEVNNSISWTYKLFGTSLDYNTTTYETASESFIINLLADAVQEVTATLNYDGTVYSTTKIGNDAEMTFTSSITHLEGDIGNKSFYWNFSYGSEHISSTTYYQDVQELVFAHCNASNGEMFINFTFKDEGNLTAIPSKFQTTNWKYWIGDGTVYKTLSYTNITAGYNVSFCLNNNYTLYTLGDIRYEDTEYPQRLWTESSTLTNDTTTRILYMLHEDDGIYSTIQIVDQQGDAVIGALVTVERQFNGIWTIVAQASSDSAGLVTFWVNPNYDHRFTFIKDGCIGATFTLRPTQATYTAQLNCQDAPTTYISPIDGLKYARFPAEGIISPGLTNFSFQTLSSKGNLNQIKIAIVNATGYVLATNTTDCSTTTSDCMVWVQYLVQDGDDIKGIYYVDIGNGLFAIEADAHWVNVDASPSGSLDIFTFINDLKYALNGWSTDDNTGDFNRLVFVFFFMCLFICVFNAYTGMDNANPGAFMIFLTAVVFIGSIANGGTGQGFFYYNNLTNWTFFNNYILVMMLGITTFGTWINVNRQAAR